MGDFIRSEGLLPLRCTVSRPAPQVCVAHLVGELDMATAPLLAHHLREQTATRPTELVLDLGDVTLLPGVRLHGRTSVGAGAVVGPDTTLTDTEVGPGALVRQGSTRVPAAGVQSSGAASKPPNSR